MWRIGCLAPRSQLRNTRVSAAGRPRGEPQAPRGLPGPLDSVKDGVTTENRGDIPGRTCLATAAAPAAQSKDDDRESSLLPWPRSGVPPRCQGNPRSPGVGEGSPPVPSWSVPGGFGAKLLSPAQTRRGKLRISLWAPKSLPAKAEAQVPGGVHGGTGRVPLVRSSPLPRARRARHPLCPPCTALRAPFPPRGIGPGAHPEARSCVVTRLCACLGLRAAAQAATLPGPGPLACGPGSHCWASATAPGPGRPQRLCQPGPSQLVSPGSCIRRRRRPSPPQTTRGRQASGARPPGPRAAPVHAFLLLSPRRDGVLHTGSSRPPPPLHASALPSSFREVHEAGPAVETWGPGRGNRKGAGGRAAADAA